MIPVTLDAAVDRVLDRLDDLKGRTAETLVYSRAEIKLYIKDGYDRLCRRTKCLWDQVYIENLPATGNWSTEEEYELAKEIPNLILTGKRNFTREVDKILAPAGSVGPAGISTHNQISLLDLIDGVSYTNPTGQLPREMVEIERVIHDEVTIFPEFASGIARYMDNRFETKTGDPDWFTVDKDGIFTLRRYPSGDAQADYGDDEITGTWGVETYDDEYTGDIVGGPWGAMTHDSENFPMEGPWGASTRLHPDVNNTRVELIRLGKDILTNGIFEIPNNYIKYVVFWACHRALKRDGPGQDVKLAAHYAGRFETGVQRLMGRVQDIQAEYTGRIGHGPQRSTVSPLHINLPYNYGRSRPRRRY